MKLDDIDILVSARSDYNSIRNQLAAAKAYRPGTITFYNTHVNDPEIMEAVRQLTIKMVSEKLEFLKAKLATLGIGDLPE